MKPASSSVVRRPARLAVSLALLGLCALGAAPAAPAQVAEEGVPAAPANGGSSTGDDAARAALRAGTAEANVLSIHAAQLVEANDLDTLRELLATGGRNAVLGILSALQVRFADGLLGAVTDVAAARDAELAARASELLRDQVRARAGVLTVLAERLAEPGLDAAARRLLVEVLGQSRDLRAVPPLLAELSGPAAAPADLGLSELSGHRPRRPYEPALYWPPFWEQQAGVPRELLLERELHRERDEHREEMARKNDEIVQTRVATMGQDVDRLLAAVTDEFRRVRLVAVQRLGAHPNQEQAVNAVPLLLRRLGGGASDAGESGDAAREVDSEVRTAIVTALGVLGRGRADVQSALLDVLRTANGPIASAAVDALARERDQPQVVPPLLQYIGRSEVPPATLVTVLLIVAQNRPDDVFAELAHWMKPSFGADVRAAAVEAVLADAQLGRALSSVMHLAAPEQPPQVRFALAKALGKRMRVAAPQAEDVRPRVLQLLADLSDDVDPSVRAEAASSLGEFRDASALTVLERRALTETDRKVVEKLLEALGSLRLDGGVPVIGRIGGQWSGEGRGPILDASQRALSSLAEGRDAGGWFELASTLADAGSASLAAWACRETLRRFEGVLAAREPVQRARGLLAEVLLADGNARDAHDLLVQLHDGKAPFPGPMRRLELLARTSAALGLWAEAAGYYAQLLDQQDPGDAVRLTTRRSYAHALMEAGRSEAALRELEGLFAVAGPDAELTFWRALLFERLERHAEAEDVLLHLLEDLPAGEESFRERVRATLERVQQALGTARAGERRAEDSAEVGGR